MSHDLEITNHAVVRWIERVEGVALDDVRRQLKRRLGRRPDDADLLAAIERQVGLFACAVREQFPKDVLRRAISLGARRVRWRGVEFVLRNGSVVTIVTRAAH